ALDVNAFIYVVGGSSAQDYPTTPNAFQPSNFATDSVLTVLAPDASAYAYSTFFGGGGAFERANAVAVDAGGFVYVAGTTRAEDMPTPRGVQPVYGGGLNDGYVAKFDIKQAGEDSLLWATYVSGDSEDRAFRRAHDTPLK